MGPSWINPRIAKIPQVIYSSMAQRSEAKARRTMTEFRRAISESVGYALRRNCKILIQFISRGKDE